jgi:RNA polymerase sigma factor (sigma-70 family)
MELAVRSIQLPMSSADQRTFEACYARHWERVYRLCLRYCGGSNLWAEDVTHDVFIKLVERLPGLDNTEDLGAWLYRVASNLSLKRLRKERSVFGKVQLLLRGTAPEAVLPPDSVLEGKQESAEVFKAIHALAPKERVVVLMKVLDGKKQVEIAQTLAMSKGNVSKLLSRAKAKLREQGWEMEVGDDDA